MKLPYADLSFIDRDPKLKASLVRRFWKNVHFVGDCLEAKRAEPNGYGSMRVYASGINMMLPLHRLAWALFIGPPDPWKQIDHKCRNRRCAWWLQHLCEKTPRENVLSNSGPSAKNAQATHCPYGHEYSSENTIVKGRARRRYCRICHNERQRNYHATGQFKLTKDLT